MRELREEAARFNRRAARYDRWLKQRWFFRPVHRLLLQALDLRPGERFLEIGCGTGNLTLAAAAVTGSAVGVDPARRMIEVARSKEPSGGRVEFLVGAAESLPFPDVAFDAAASSISMHHWVDPVAGLREVRRVLRPGGRLVVADVAPTGLGWALGLTIGVAKRGHGGGWEREELAETVQLTGFERVRIRRPSRLGSLVAVVAAETPTHAK
jgi:ubiquinone/menaquinone biosynthesis C-methylase UbiE